MTTEPIESAQPKTPEFVRLVTEALEKKNIKPKCPGCSAIGWANFEIFPVPTVTPTLAQNTVLYSAVIHCLKCGLKTERNLNLLGISIQPEQRRVLTASEIAAQQKQSSPLIVTG